MTRNSAETDFDVVVIGGGPSGLAAALALGSKLRTLVLERQPVPRRKSCGGLLSPITLKLTEAMGLRMPDWVCATPDRPRALHYLDLDSGESRVAEDVGIVNVHRKAFDHWLWQEASKVSTCLAGSECIGVRLQGSHGEAIVDVRNILTQQEYSIEAGEIVIADGAGSAIRQSLGVDTFESAVTIQEAIDPPRDPGAMKNDVLYALAGDVTPLYSWAIPKGDYWLLGSGFFGVDGLDKRFNALKERIARHVDLRGRVLWRDVSRISVFKSMEQLDQSFDNVHFVGEAGGFVNQVSGEGVSFALLSGVLCAARLSDVPHTAIDGHRAMLTRLQESLEHSIFLHGGSSFVREYISCSHGS